MRTPPPPVRANGASPVRFSPPRFGAATRTGGCWCVQAPPCIGRKSRGACLPPGSAQQTREGSVTGGPTRLSGTSRPGGSPCPLNVGLFGAGSGAPPPLRTRVYQTRGGGGRHRLRRKGVVRSGGTCVGSRVGGGGEHAAVSRNLTPPPVGGVANRSRWCGIMATFRHHGVARFGFSGGAGETGEPKRGI